MRGRERGKGKGRGKGEGERERSGVDTVASYLHDLSPACQVLIEGARKWEHTYMDIRNSLRCIPL